MKNNLLRYIKSKCNDVDLKNNEDHFLQSIFKPNNNIKIHCHTFLVQYKQRYLEKINKTCDLLLNNLIFKIWIEGKKKVKLLPINCCQIPEKIILTNDSSYLDIARLIALVKNQNENDLRFTLSTVNKEILEYYKRRLLCAEVIRDNDNEIQIKSEFVCIDILPVESNRKKMVELYCNAILDNYFIKLPINSIYVIVSFIVRGIVSLKVYRDIDDPYYEGKKCMYGEDQNGDDEFLSKYFPSS